MKTTFSLIGRLQLTGHIKKTFNSLAAATNDNNNNICIVAEERNVDFAWQSRGERKDGLWNRPAGSLSGFWLYSNFLKQLLQIYNCVIHFFIQTKTDRLK